MGTENVGCQGWKLNVPQGGTLVHGLKPQLHGRGFEDQAF